MEKKVFSRPEALRDVPTHYCPGCHHGIIHRLVAEAVDELGVREKTVGIGSIGCSVLAYDYFNFDVISALHGRAPATATGAKRSRPDRLVFTYQGDGDLAAIGTAEIVHAAARGENISVIFVNNAIYGMTGGQMAPTTLDGQVTQTTPAGRSLSSAGNPIRVAEMLATLDGPAFIARVSVHTPKHILDAKKAIKKSFALQLEGKGFSLVEVLSTCPTNWGMTPVASSEWVASSLVPHYPLGVKKDLEEGAAQ
ncbi:MAG: 2-oxoglutarate oxidoreductase [Deltaproteobacteria bacterium]|jgi:2-oxoglutarate ferredoxin oxidoreductase subunit beta|nr:2-oxoglutarate oxidoreductase [Deltaproteobacteria bacterium]